MIEHLFEAGVARHTGDACCSICTVRLDRLDHDLLPRSGAKKLKSRSRISAADCSLVHVHPQHVETRLDQPLGGLPVEVKPSVRAARRELEAVMRPALTQPFRDDLGVGFQDDGQVGPAASALSCQRKTGSAPSKRCITRPDGIYSGHSAPPGPPRCSVGLPPQGGADEQATLVVRKGPEVHPRPLLMLGRAIPPDSRPWSPGARTTGWRPERHASRGAAKALRTGPRPA